MTVVAFTILAEAQDDGADGIVVHLHGRKYFGHLDFKQVTQLGSFSAKVESEMACEDRSDSTQPGNYQQMLCNEHGST